MNEEILIALGDLTNGALNYYQTPRVVMAKRDIIETYINNLKEIEKEHQKINGELREEIKGIREERDYLFNKLSIENKYLSQENQQLQNNWNELNKFIEDNLKSLEENITNKKCDNAVAIYGREMNGFYKVRRKMQELEQGKDE